MLRFYGDVLGLPSAGRPLTVAGFGTLHRFAVGSNVLKVIELEQPSSSKPSGGPPEAAAGMRYITLYVRDLDAALEPVIANGHPIVTGPAEPVPGVRFAIIADPDGNCVEFVQGP
jgi:catechol 2,3-dioxygenase-like lactoylglutathione lyase family enzyme